MFGRRRRPLVRAAAVGGAGYAIGKRRERGQQEDQYAEDDSGSEPAGLGDDAIAELEKLGTLKDKGILTQEEFDEQKAKILDAS